MDARWRARGVDIKWSPTNDPLMGKRRQRQTLWAVVDELQNDLALLYSVALELSESLILEGDDRIQVVRLHQEARSQVEPIALGIDALGYSCIADSPTRAYGKNLAHRGTITAGFLGGQLRALDIMIDGLAVIGAADGSDEEFVRDAIESCAAVYDAHLTILAALRKSEGQSTLAMAHMRKAGAIGVFVDLDRLTTEFRQVKKRILEDQSGR